MKRKSNVLVDIKQKYGPSIYSSDVKNRINLSVKRRRNFSHSIQRYVASFMVFALLLGFSSVFAPTVDTMAQTTTGSMSDEKQALEAELEKLEAEMAEYQKTIDTYKKQGNTLSGEIKRLMAQVDKINLQIKAVNLNLTRLDKDIASTSNKITTTESEMDKKKEAISGALRSMNSSEGQNIVEMLMLNPSINDFFTNISNLTVIQSSLQDNLRDLEALREDYVTEKSNLSDQKTNAQQLKNLQLAQKQAAEDIRRQKDSLLKTTKGKESEYQKLLKDKEKQAAQIRNRLFHLMGGGEMTFEQAYNLAKYASSATGVRPEILLAILDQESALGKNVGKCDYKTAMHPTRDIPIFLDIVASLGLQDDLASGKLKVSCAIVSDGSYGGAMGPSQFIPSTWKLYAERIKSVTGGATANPWSNRDAFVATALYIKDAISSKACTDYSNQIPSQSQTLLERCAAAKYYAGNNWYKYRFAYGDSVLDRAERFESDIAIIKGQ